MMQQILGGTTGPHGQMPPPPGFEEPNIEDAISEKQDDGVETTEEENKEPLP